MDLTRVNIKTMKRLDAIEKILFAIAEKVGVDPQVVLNQAEASPAIETVNEITDGSEPSETAQKVKRGKGDK